MATKRKATKMQVELERLTICNSELEDDRRAMRGELSKSLLARSELDLQVLLVQGQAREALRALNRIHSLAPEKVWAAVSVICGGPSVRLFRSKVAADAFCAQRASDGRLAHSERAVSLFEVTVDA